MSLLLWLPSRGSLPDSPPCDATDIPVVFLHGTLASPGNFELPATELARLGVPFFAPAYGQRGTGDLDESRAELVDFILKLPVSQIDIVGHSLGGLMGLKIAHALPGRVRTLVGLGACYKGVPISYRFPRLVHWIGGPALTQLTKTTRFVLSEPKGTRVVSIISSADRIVPESSSTLGEIIHIDGVRHEILPQQTREIMAALGLSGRQLHAESGSSA